MHSTNSVSGRPATRLGGIVPQGARSKTTSLETVVPVPGGSRARVLIVDDCPENIHVLLRTLTGSCDILAATTPARALRLAVQQTPEVILLDVVMPEKSGFDLCAELKLDPRTADIPVIFISAESDPDQQRRGLDAGGVDYLLKPFDPDMVRVRVATQIELHRLRLATRRQQLDQQHQQDWTEESDDARQLQLSLVPASVCRDPRLGNWQLAAHLRPARAVGGDLYDYFFIGKHKLLFALGDVSDKGIPAALFMVQVRTLLRVWGRTVPSPARLLETLNRSLCDDNETGMFVTMLCGVVDLRTGVVTLASAGHAAPLLISPEGEARVEQMPTGGALGLWKYQSFKDHELQLAARESVALYSDGLTQATSDSEEAFGLDRLLHTASCSQPLAAAELTETILAAHHTFVGSRDLADDLALLVLQRPALPLPSCTIHSFEQLPELHAVLQAGLTACSFGPESSHDLLLVTEELVSNAFHHGSPAAVTMNWRRVGDFFEVNVSDDGTPFNLTEALHSGMGAGLTLIHNLTDHLSYRLVNGLNSTVVRLRDSGSDRTAAGPGFFHN